MKDLVVILHNVRSIYNVGSIFRTADAAGVSKIYLAGITPAPIDRFGKTKPRFAKVSLGAEKSVPWEKFASAAKPLHRLKKENYKIFAVEQSKKSVPYYKTPEFHTAASSLCLVLGNEVSGLPPAVLRLADKILEIPMRGKKESLNVGVAFGIVVFGLLYGD
jgi:tRNA G18 (ribose-2'-O)-methylase SpoU